MISRSDGFHPEDLSWAGRPRTPTPPDVVRTIRIAARSIDLIVTMSSHFLEVDAMTDQELKQHVEHVRSMLGGST